MQSYVNEYKRKLLEALIREGVNDWEQVKRGLSGTNSPFLPNPNEFAKQCRGAGEITGTWGTGAHRIFRRDRRLEDEGAKQRAAQAGAEELERMKELLA